MHTLSLQCRLFLICVSYTLLNFYRKKNVCRKIHQVYLRINNITFFIFISAFQANSKLQTNFCKILLFISSLKVSENYSLTYSVQSDFSSVYCSQIICLVWFNHPEEVGWCWLTILKQQEKWTYPHILRICENDKVKDQDHH